MTEPIKPETNTIEYIVLPNNDKNYDESEPEKNYSETEPSISGAIDGLCGIGRDTLIFLLVMLLLIVIVASFVKLDTDVRNYFAKNDMRHDMLAYNMLVNSANNRANPFRF
jgi:hypothetical protein